MIIYNSYPLFAEAFKPVINPLFPQGPYEGCLFDKANPALLASNIGIKRTWTVIRYTEVLNDIDNTEVVKLLLNASVNIDKQDNNGYTALILAAYENNREIIELLLDYGADEFILNDENKSFYDYLNYPNQQYFTQNYPTSVYNAIYHKYKKSFTEFVKDYNIKIKK